MSICACWYLRDFKCITIAQRSPSCPPESNMYHEFQDVLFRSRFKKFRSRICRLAASLGNLSKLCTTVVEKSWKVRCNTADLQLHIITTGGNDLSWYANVTGKRPRYYHVHVCLRVVWCDNDWSRQWLQVRSGCTLAWQSGLVWNICFCLWTDMNHHAV